MKKIGLIYFLFLMQYFAIGQSIQRSQSNLPILSDEKATIEKPNGWVLQDNGVWKSSLGKILLFDSERNRKPDQIQKLGQSNIIKMVLKEVLVGDYQYAILLVYSSGGYYEFPDLRQGFHKTKIVDYYVFEAKKLDKILPLDIKYNEAFAVNLEVFAYDHLVNIDKKDIDTKISYNILRTLRQKIVSEFTSILNVMPVITNGKKFFRFRLVKILNKKNLYQKYLLKENRDKLFTRTYYEVPFQEFVDFFSSINIIKPDFNVENPVNFADFYKRGVMRFDRGHYEGALSDFNAAIQLEPENRFMMLYAYMGSTQHELENYPAAIRAFDKAIVFKPTDPSQRPAWVRVYYNRGVSKYKMEDKMNACKDMNRAKILGLQDEDALKTIKKSCKGRYKDVVTK